MHFLQPVVSKSIGIGNTLPARKLGEVWTWFWYQVKAENVLFPMVPKFILSKMSLVPCFVGVHHICLVSHGQGWKSNFNHVKLCHWDLSGTCSLLSYWYIGPLGLNPDRLTRFDLLGSSINTWVDFLWVSETCKLMVTQVGSNLIQRLELFLKPGLIFFCCPTWRELYIQYTPVGHLVHLFAYRESWY